MTSLYERLGGEAAIDAAVEQFCGRILADAKLAPVFAGVEMNRLKFHQRRFLGFAFGGPGGYQGRDLAVAHRPIAQKRGIDDSHFDAVVRHLDDTLGALGVEEDLRLEALTVAESVRDAVLGRPGVSFGSPQSVAEVMSATGT